jgi:8-oxo-dGTP pyrophosphatase MutT (NUDIX family)
MSRLRAILRTARTSALGDLAEHLVNRRWLVLMFRTIAEFAPEGTEAGVGLALQDEAGRYLFFLAGTRHRCPPGELFYAGIGGHREAGEDWLACAHREVKEEIGTEVDIAPASLTWYVPHQGPVRRLDVGDRPRPLALCEMIHPLGTPRPGERYRIVIYKARLQDKPKVLLPDEVRGVIALTETQVVRGLDCKPALAELLEEGACLVVGEEHIDLRVRLYPLGTASAIAHILRHIRLEESVGRATQDSHSAPMSGPAPNDEQ